MRYDPPHTVDVSAEQLEPFERQVIQPLDTRSAISQSFGVDIFLFFISLLAGVLFSGAIGAIDTGSLSPNVANVGVLIPSRWFIIAVCAFPAICWLFVDTLSALSNPATLPFARSKAGMKAVYARRIHLGLLAFYFTAILVALCWSAFSMLLVSKLFVSAVFAIALYALGQSIPSRRLSFIVSGLLFVVVLVTTQAFIVTRLEADSNRANEESLEGFDGRSADEETDESIFESLGE
ncbi:MAG: hypothetical protein ABG776_10145 [Cyanobacteria bacterium J06555_13]